MTPTDEEVKRYQVYGDGLWHSGDKVTEVWTEGEWVRSEDHDRIVSSLRAEIERLNARELSAQCVRCGCSSFICDGEIAMEKPE